MKEFYNGKKVIVTGGASFIGSHLVEKLLSLGSSVTVIDDLSSGKIENIENVSTQIDFVKGDLRNQDVAMEAFKGHNYVFHLANIHGGRGFIETHPGEISQNFLIDGNVLLAAKDNLVSRFCYASSACVYPTNLQIMNPTEVNRYLSEEMADPFKIGGANSDGVYGWAKFMGEMALKSYNKQFGLKGVSCRLFTVYGPRENESHAIIAFIARALLKQDPYEVWGSGNQDRNFTYVDDVVEGMLLATSRIHDCSAINIGTKEITKIKDAVMEVCKIVGHKPNDFYFDISKPEGVSARAASVKLQKEILDWEPNISFSEGVLKTINWYSQNTNIQDLRDNFERKLMER
jgi:UDP-glucose 4-epimerase